MNAFESLLGRLRADYPNFADLWDRSRQQFGPGWVDDVSRHIARVFGDTPGPAWQEAVDGYAEFCTDALRAQVFFERHGRYPASQYAETYETCYRSAEYMERRYLPGQYLSHYIWPHHYRMLQGFRTEVLPAVGPDARTFYEVGVGCGMYSLATLEAWPGAHGVGVDISPYALRFTARVIAAAGRGEAYEIIERDIFADPPLPPRDFLICQEVLEHLENPAAFVARLRQMVTPAGAAYITAAINAAHTDHIYLYRSPAEVQAQLEQAGWHVVCSQVETTHQERPAHLRPTIAGFLVRPA